MGSTRTCISRAQSLGIGDRWREVGRAYAAVNKLFGDIVKVTPTSKVVGDMTLFMIANNLTPEMVLEPNREIAFPESVVEFFEGKLGQPPGGFPPELQKRVLRGRKPLTDRPGATLLPVDFAQGPQGLGKQARRTPTDEEVISYLLYPKVFVDSAEYRGEVFRRERASDAAVLFRNEHG